MKPLTRTSLFVTPALALMIGSASAASAISASASATHHGGAYGLRSAAMSASAKPPQTACSTLRLNPADGSDVAFINSQVSFAYSSEQGKLCGDIALVDASGKPVASKQVYRSEWNSPSGGVAGTVTIEPQENLQPGTTYQVMAAGTLVGSFSTEPSSIPRGVTTQVVDKAVAFGGLPQSARIPVEAINNLLRTYLSSLLHDPALEKTAYDLLSKEVPHLASPQARFNARVKKVSYTSSDAKGLPITLSGLLIYPENPDGSPFDFAKAGMVLGEHGSAKSDQPAVSSASTPDVMVGLLAAGKGHVFFAPDLIGFGDTATLPQSYLVTLDTATASQDLLLAVRRYINNRFPTTPLGKDLRIVGGSQGGFSSVAVMPYLTHLANIKGVFAGEGPYNIEQTLASSIEAIAGLPLDGYSKYENLDFVPDHLQSVLDSYRAYQGFNFKQGDIFTGKSLNPTFVQAFAAGKYPLMQKHLGLNSLINNNVAYYAPAAKVVLYHYSKDSLVPAQNTEDMLTFLNNGTHVLASASRGDCKENSLFSRLFLTFSHSKEKTHLVCGVYWLDGAVANF